MHRKYTDNVALPSPLSSSRTFSSSEGDLVPISSHFPCPCPQPSATTNLLPASITYSVHLIKWNHTTHELLCLASFLSIIFLRFIRIVARISISFFFMTVIFQHMDAPHLFFCSSVSVHSGCLHLLAIWIMLLLTVVYKYLVLILLGIFLAVEMRGLYGNSMFNFWEAIQQFLIAAAPFSIPTSSIGGSSSSTSLLTLATLLLKNYSHPSGCEVASHCGSDLHFSNGVGHYFMCLSTICMSSLEKWLFKYFAHFILLF